MTFRVQMDTPNPDGTPRYIYYSPSSLWDWVRQSSSNGKLPHNPSQKILKADWYRLHANYDQNGPVPHWVNDLEKEHAFLARMARAEQRVRDRLAREAEERRRREEQERREREAREAQERREREAREARERKERRERERREAEERRANELRLLLRSGNALPGGEPGRIRLEEQAIVRWRFWTKANWSTPQTVHRELKRWFAKLVHNLQLTPLLIEKRYGLRDIDGWTAAWPGLAVRLRQVRNADGSRQFTEMLFAARMPRAFAAWFAEWATSIVDRFGYDDFLRRAHRHYGFFGGAKYGCTFDHPHVVELGTPVEDPEWCEMPTMTDEEYRTAEEVHLIRKPEGWVSEIRDFDRTVADDDEPFPPEEPTTRLRWRFWLKGDAKKPTLNQLKKRFVAHVMKAPPEGMGATSRDPWKNLEVTRDMYAFTATEEGDDPNAMRIRGSRPTYWIWIYKFGLTLKKSDADAFVAHFRDRSAVYGKAAYMYRKIFDLDSSVKTADGDWQYPWKAGDPAPSGWARLTMTQQEYDAWNTQAELHRELFGSDSEGEE